MPARSHGLSRDDDPSGLYATWKNVRQRCTNPANPAYKNYGGRGITICVRWGKFENFLADMTPKPSPSHTIERRNNDGNYCPSNCYWLEKGKQRKNTRGTHLFRIAGEVFTLSELAGRVGISPTAMKYRIAAWGVQRALAVPVDDKKVKAGNASAEQPGNTVKLNRARKLRTTAKTPVSEFLGNWTRRRKAWRDNRRKK